MLCTNAYVLHNIILMLGKMIGQKKMNSYIMENTTARGVDKDIICY